MKIRLNTTTVAALTTAAALSLSACGGGGEMPLTAAAPTPMETAFSDSVATPTFHRLPDAVEAPDASDETGQSLSAFSAPRQVRISSDVAVLDTRQLTDERVAAARTRTILAGVKPAAATVTAVVYTPAQIRAAYGLPTLPASYSNLSPTAAAALGAGQTVYVVDAYDHPNAAADLAKFSAQFGLPTCSVTALATNVSLPLAAAAKTGCTFSKVFTTANGSAMTATAPAYNAGWAGEIALDVQWAHAIAPLARIVLIESPDAGVASLLGTVALAGKMGPGNVSMSWGAAEASWELSYDSAFLGAGMTYFAASGDAGAQVNWPATSPNVVAVGGTTLAYSGVGTRSESTWSGTGGGSSLYEAVPTWQKSVQPSGTGRASADVSFNANPSSGQYVYFTAPGATGAWYSYGGTSLSTPQWASLVAVSNAQRAASGKAAFGGSFLSMLYAKNGVGTARYGLNFLDVKTGSNGTCARCIAATGYDLPTGQGTPNAASLLPQLLAD